MFDFLLFRFRLHGTLLFTLILFLHITLLFLIYDISQETGNLILVHYSNVKIPKMFTKVKCLTEVG